VRKPCVWAGSPFYLKRRDLGLVSVAERAPPHLLLGTAGREEGRKCGGGPVAGVGEPSSLRVETWPYFGRGQGLMGEGGQAAPPRPQADPLGPGLRSGALVL
jgi:hypothetical protein